MHRGGLWSTPCTSQTQAEASSTAVALQPPSDVAAVGPSDGQRLVIDGDIGINSFVTNRKKNDLTSGTYEL